MTDERGFLYFVATAPQWARDSSFKITDNDAPQSVGLLWTSDQLTDESFNIYKSTYEDAR